MKNVNITVVDNAESAIDYVSLFLENEFNKKYTQQEVVNRMLIFFHKNRDKKILLRELGIYEM